MQEQYVYLLRLQKEEYSLPHIKAFTDRELAFRYYENDVKFYRKTGWEVDDDKNYCAGGTAIRRAEMVRAVDGGYEHMTLLLDALTITKKWQEC